jgi:hypothetical protein
MLSRGSAARRRIEPLDDIVDDENAVIGVIVSSRN